jgi:hypothetical protein
MTDNQYADHKSAIDAAEYRRLTERFDRLWDSAPSAYKQREMRKLLALINRYEAGRHDGNDSHNHQPAGREIRHPQISNSV